jgi:hypothetical protein
VYVLKHLVYLGADARNLALSDAMQEDVDMHSRLVESHGSLSDETASLRQRVRELEAVKLNLYNYYH